MSESTPTESLKEAVSEGVRTAIGPEAEQLLMRLKGRVSFLETLRVTHVTLWDAEDSARSRLATDEQIASVKRQIDGLNAERHKLINRFDGTLSFTTPQDGAQLLSETPGELIDRLLIISLKHHHAKLTAEDVNAKPEARKLCFEKTRTLISWRDHLRACLVQSLMLATEGKAVLPPRSEFKMYNHPDLNPVLRSEGTSSRPTKGRRFPHIEATHVLGLACTGHGVGLALASKDGGLRATTLDRWASTKDTLMFSADEERDIILAEDRSPVDLQLYEILRHAFGRFPHYRVFETDIVEWTNWFLKDSGVTRADIDLIVVSESHMCTNEFRLGPHLTNWFPKARVVGSPEHHEIHQRQAFWQSGFEEAAVLTLDTCGENLARLGGISLSGTISHMTRSGGHKLIREMYFPEQSSGLIYALSTHHIGFSQGQEGKTMGLAPYGRPDFFDEIKDSLTLHPDGTFNFLAANDFTRRLEDYVPARPLSGRPPLLPRHEDIAFAAQALLELIICNAWKAALAQTGSKNLVFAGGVALNSVANELAYRAARPEAFYIAPNPGDTGQALGAALMGAYEMADWEPTGVQLTDYIGPGYSKEEIEAASGAKSEVEMYRATPEDPDHIAARVIANGHILARFGGRAEHGPRALGNRSILGDPRRADMKDFLNSQVKFREGFRPFAPSALAEHCHDWFDIEGKSPYMLRVVPVKEDKRALVPAIVHVDGTGRLQTVGDEHPGYRRVIESFYELTGVPLVINTSFNIAGKPIVETPEQAVECFLGTAIDVLVLGHVVMSKKPLEYYLQTDRAPLAVPAN